MNMIKKEFDLKRSLPSKEIGSFQNLYLIKNLTDLKLYLTFVRWSFAKKITKSSKYSDFETRSSWDNLFR